MSGDSKAEKCREACAYLSRHVSSSLAQELQFEMVRTHMHDERTFYQDITTAGARFSGANKDACRMALRALLLCQRYFSPGLATADGREGSDWPNVTIHFWSQKTELDLIAALSMYTTLAVPLSVSAVAARGVTATNSGDYFFTLTRSPATLTRRGEVCYEGVRLWLLLAGHISLRWYRRHPVPNNLPAGIPKAFGTADVTHELSQLQPQQIRLLVNNLPADLVLYIFKSDGRGKPHAYSGGGHWMVTAGGGLAYGMNNGAQNTSDLVTYGQCAIVDQITYLSNRTSHTPNNVGMAIYRPESIGD